MIIEKIKGTKFEVTDGIKCGICYSMYSYFDVWWYDGTRHLGIMDLSDFGYEKTFRTMKST